MKESDSITSYYQQRAAEYEQIYYLHIPEKRKEIDDEAKVLREVVNQKDILDLACGTGYWTVIMSETAANIIAGDISLAMINQAKQKHYRCPVHFVQSDIYKLPFTENSFDVISLGFWFSHEPRQNHQSFFEMLKPLLKKDGLIWMIDNNPPAEESTKNVVRIDSYGNSYKKRMLDNGKEFIIIKNYFIENELRGIFSLTFSIKRLVHKKYYWSALLKKR